jgi:hypothetical protein
MDKPNQKLLDHWIENRTKLCFTFNGGKKKHGHINCCFGLAIHVKIDDFKGNQWKTRKVLLLNKLDSIVEVREDVTA